mgnify:CR=1 FL=1
MSKHITAPENKSSPRETFVEVTVVSSLNTDQIYPTKDLIRKIESGTDQLKRVSVSALKGRWPLDNGSFTIRLDLNTATGGKEWTLKTDRDTDNTDRIRFKCTRQIPLIDFPRNAKRMAETISKVAHEMDCVEDEFTYSVTVEFLGLDLNSHSFGQSDLTDRRVIDQGFIAELFDNKIRMKQVSINKIESGISALKEIITEETQN